MHNTLYKYYNYYMQIRTCKYCNRSLNSTFFKDESRVCNGCVEGTHFSKEEIDNNKKRDFCKHCEQEFAVSSKNKKHVCDKCRDKIDEYFTICVKCEQTYSRENNFHHKKIICDECAEAINAEKYFNKTYRYCEECKEYKTIGKEISYKAFSCSECVKNRRKARIDSKKKSSWVRICPDCGVEVITFKPRATVVYCQICHDKKIDIKKQKNEMNRVKQDYCQICKKKTPNDEDKDRVIVCVDCRPKMKEFMQSCLRNGEYFKICVKCGEEFKAIKSRFWNPIYCYDCCHPKQPNNICHKYGYQGICSDGHRFTSLNEMDFDEWLVSRNIKHTSHPRLKPSYRCSDYYLSDYDVYVEMDGLERKDDIDWCGKLSLYEKLGVKYFIVTPAPKHFVENSQICFKNFDEKVLPLL